MNENKKFVLNIFNFLYSYIFFNTVNLNKMHSYQLAINSMHINLIKFYDNLKNYIKN